MFVRSALIARLPMPTWRHDPPSRLSQLPVLLSEIGATTARTVRERSNPTALPKPPPSLPPRFSRVLAEGTDSFAAAIGPGVVFEVWVASQIFPNDIGGLLDVVTRLFSKGPRKQNEEVVRSFHICGE